MMIVEYHRPKTSDEALALLSRKDIKTFPLGGGTILNQPTSEKMVVVDLQLLGFNTLKQEGKKLIIGSTVTLQEMLDYKDLYPALHRAVQHETTYNTRQIATIAGRLIASDGRSPITTTMLALDVQITLLPGDEIIPLGDLLPQRPGLLEGRLITEISCTADIQLTYDYVARTPADLPIVCVSVARWSSGRTRVALGGFGTSPILAFDGPNSDGAELAAKDAYLEANDQWASGEYRSAVAYTLTKRSLAE